MLPKIELGIANYGHTFTFFTRISLQKLDVTNRFLFPTYRLLILSVNGFLYKPDTDKAFHVQL